jgi:hypothetical protein
VLLRKRRHVLPHNRHRRSHAAASFRRQHKMPQEAAPVQRKHHARVLSKEGWLCCLQLLQHLIGQPSG